MCAKRLIHFALNRKCEPYGDTRGKLRRLPNVSGPNPLGILHTPTEFHGIHPVVIEIFPPPWPGPTLPSRVPCLGYNVTSEGMNVFICSVKRHPKYLQWYPSKALPFLSISAAIRSAESLLPSLASPSLNLPSRGKILNSATEEPVTSWSHKYYVLCFPHCCLMFHIEVGTVKQTTAHKRMGPLIPRGIILAEGVFSTGPARKSY